MPVRMSAALAAVATAAATLALAPATDAAPAPACVETSWTAGTTEWCAGTLVYRDYVYDDRGADTGALTAAIGAWETDGDVDHRAHGQTLNSTDLLALRLGRSGDRMTVRFELNALTPGDGTIAAIALDTDDDVTTGGGPWGRVGVSSRGWEQVHVFTTRDPATNAITGTVPLPPARVVRVQAVVATGDGTPMNVAFRTTESGPWWESRQAADLADSDVGIGRVFDVRSLGRHHAPAPPPRPGLHGRVFRSRFPLGEGVLPDGHRGPTGALFHFVGAAQPYALYVPRRPGPLGAQLVLHGAFENHSQLVSRPGMQRAMGERAGRVLVSPLGRGPSNSWVDWAARDAIDALDDAIRVTGADRERVVVSGYSMGGGGTMFLSTLFPDRFASAIAWNAFTGDCLAGTPLAQGGGRPDAFDGLDSNDPAKESGCPLETRGNSVDYLENLRHVPAGYLFGAMDEVVWANHGVAVFDRLETLRYEFKLWEHTGDHFTFPNFDVWDKEAEWSLERRVVRRPARVTYRTNTHLYRPDLELVPDGAYWVDGLRPLDPSTTPEGDMVVDLTSHRCRTRSDLFTDRVVDAGSSPVPWVGVARVPDIIAGPVPDNVISGTLTNVAAVTIDRSDACFAPGEPVELRITTDPRTVITFRD